MKNKIKLFASCMPVKGINKSIICDLQRNSYFFIPNDMYDVLEQSDGKTIEELKKIYNYKFDEIIDEYFDFLYKNEFIFYTKTPDLFPKMNLDWHEPFEITNAIIDIDKEIDFEKVLFELDSLKCKSLEFRFYDVNCSLLIKKILRFIDNQKLIVFSVGFVIPSSNFSNIENLKSILFKNPRISYFLVSNSDMNEIIQPIREKMGYIVYTKDKINSNANCGIINLKSFNINIKLFTESQAHNTCLNRKISIDKHGNIKNCPSMPESYGNIKNVSLQDALNHPEFRKYWNVNKDMITVCKDCEFRHICTDCRAYTERTDFEGDIDLSKPLKCGYNPYTNEWAEWSTNPLKQKAIEYYGMQDLVKKDA